MRRQWLWTLVVLLAVAAGSWGLFTALQPPALPESLLYGNGHIEGAEIRISAEVTGRVVASRLVEGRRVKAGDLLLRIDDETVRLRLAKARAETTAIENEIAVLEAQLRTWKHHLRTAEQEVQRFRQLRKSGTITEQQINQAEDAYQEARGRVDVLASQLRQARNRHEAARQQVRLLALALQKTRVQAPVAGTILVKAVEVGELAVPGKVLAVLVDLTQPELKIYVPEREIGRIKLGAPARVRVDAFPGRYFEGRVVRVDQRAQFTPRDIHMPE